VLLPGDDYGRFRFQNMLGYTLVGMKGSFMVVPRKLEMEIGFDHGPASSITEDAWFAFVVSRVYWCEGTLYEQSPFTIRDIIKQRRRWASGLWQVVLHHPSAWWRRLMLAVQMMCWVLAPIGWLALVCGFVFSKYQLYPSIATYNAIMTAVFMYQYLLYVSGIDTAQVRGDERHVPPLCIPLIEIL
jgi:egghead protein (zeste-white 4 protein)